MILITCVGGNVLCMKCSIEHGFKYGVQLPSPIYNRLFFADQNWKNPVRQKYMLALALYRPTIATVLDLERPEQYNEVLSWAEEASQYVEKIVIIPKYSGVIPNLPKQINNKEVILGYSVPTQYAGTKVSVEEFKGYPIHLLGGNVFQHLTLTKKLKIVSIDSNTHLKMANQYCQYFSFQSNWTWANPNWPTLKEADGRRWEGNGRMEAFRRSCVGIREFWDFHKVEITNDF